MKVNPQNRDRILNRFNRLAAFAGRFGLIVRQCDTCGKFVGLKRGHGQSGVSHAPCKSCFNRLEAEIIKQGGL